ncbi:hypothetical protein A2U01_0107722, partial [Trifolium medium]|nr:hypothetical protein [Trifolium medium]
MPSSKEAISRVPPPFIEE